MIKTERIDGFEVQYIVVDASRLDLEFNIGCTVKQLGSGHEAAINFPYAITETGVPIGRVVVDGVTVISDSEKTKNRDLFYMTKSGTAYIGPYPRTPIEWAVQGSPRLLNGGVKVLKKSIIRDNTPSDITNRNSQRTAVGIREDGNVVLLVTNNLMDLDTLTDIMSKLGCVDALNGDGGGSSYLWPEDTGWGRRVGAAIVVKNEIKKEAENTMKLIGDEHPELVIDAGHGGTDPGATSGGLFEKNFTLMIALQLFKRFKELGVKVAMTRNADITIDPGPRAELVKNSGAEVCLSCHINAGGGDGLEVIHSLHNNGKLAELIAKDVQAAGQNLRRIFSRAQPSSPGTDYYYMHRNTGNVQTNIVEFFFIDSKATGVNADLNEYKAELPLWIEGVVKAYCTYKGRKYTPEITTEPPVSTSPKEPVKIPTKDQVPTIQSRVTLSVNGGHTTDAYVIDNVTYVPIRLIAETFGAKVDWNGGNPVKITKEVK